MNRSLPLGRFTMAVRIKSISNDIQGVGQSRPNDHAHSSKKTSNDSRQVNKILELEWEALGKKLNKHVDNVSNTEIVRLQKQIREKDERLKQAEQKIVELKKQLFALQEKQRTHRQQADFNPKHRVNVPARQEKKPENYSHPKPQFRKAPRDQDRARK